MKYLWTTIHVNNLEASAKFYREMVDLKEVRRMETPDGTAYLFLGEGETQIELICKPGSQIETYSKDLSIGFKVDSVEEMMEKVKASGYEFVSRIIAPNPHIQFFFVKDPMGVIVQFVEMK